MSENCKAPTYPNVFETLILLQEKFIAPDFKGVSFRNNIGYTINLLNHIILLGITVGLSWKCFQFKLQKTAFHAYFCTLGFVFLFAEGMMARYSGNIFTSSYSAETKVTLHLVMQFIGGLLGVIGTIQKFIGKERHFKSLHGKFGLAACVFFLVHLLYACIRFHPNDKITPMVDNFVHNFLCFFTFATAMICQFYGYNTGFFKRNYTNINTYKFLTIVVFILTALYPLKMLLWQLKQTIL